MQEHNLETEVLVALRRIVQAIDQHSSRLGKEFGLTTPQLLVLQTVANTQEQPIRRQARKSIYRKLPSPRLLTA